MIASCPRKLGALLPGNSKASAVVDNYLEHVIELAMSVSGEPDSEEKCRREQTLLCSLLAQDLSRKASVPRFWPQNLVELIFVFQRIKDQIMAILLGGKVIKKKGIGPRKSQGADSIR